MKIDNQLINKMLIFCRKQWKLLALSGLILFSLLVTLTLPSKNKNVVTNPNSIQSSNPSDSSKSNSGSTNKPFNLFGIVFGPKKQESKSSQTNSQALNNLPNIITSKTSQSTVTLIAPDGSKVTQTVSGSKSISTAQGTINPNANIKAEIAGNTTLDYIYINFKNTDGSTTTYIPPGTPPDEIRWAVYTNHTDNYSLIYPYNWQFFYTIVSGHEGVALYPPGVDINDSKSPYIGFGTTDDFHLPTVGEAQGTLLTPIRVDGIDGGLYTNGPLGNSFVASVMPYLGKFFGLGSSKSDATFSYVYYYMINSINFNAE